MIWLLAFGGIVALFLGTVIFGAPYVPSHRREVRDAFCKLYPLSDRDVLVDLGAGDGRVLRIARSYGAKAVGYEINPLLWNVARVMSFKDTAVSLSMANFWTVQWPDDVTIVYMFGVSRDEKRLKRKMQHEADRLARPLFLMTYGPSLTTRTHNKKYRGHHLYEFTPLHST